MAHCNQLSVRHKSFLLPEGWVCSEYARGSGEVFSQPVASVWAFCFLLAYRLSRASSPHPLPERSSALIVPFSLVPSVELTSPGSAAPSVWVILPNRLNSIFIPLQLAACHAGHFLSQRPSPSLSSSLCLCFVWATVFLLFQRACLLTSSGSVLTCPSSRRSSLRINSARPPIYGLTKPHDSVWRFVLSVLSLSGPSWM